MPSESIPTEQTITEAVEESKPSDESTETTMASSSHLMQNEESITTAVETEKPSFIEKEVTEPTEKPRIPSEDEQQQAITPQTMVPDEERKTTPQMLYEEPATTIKTSEAEEKPSETTTVKSITTKPDFLPTEEVSSPEFPSSGSSGYGQEPDYGDEDQAFGPGTCRYGGKVYVSAQQIPRDDPCDFCFCFRSDIICLQQSCPPPIHGCHEEPIQGFCCPRYECPVSMATTLNVTTTTTTTTTTLPPHFLPHAYKGAAQRRGCHIKGHTYKVGEVVRASSGPCLHCTCGGDGQMKCDPKACTPEPMLRQMIAAAVSARRRR
ncbi:unnamed protein product [Leptosia nina]|uniref:VWFC domain-containing protein n=1 Tax=Leptosia nina TaxID=320188 RepID=A0AAV1JTG9_9NEOP